MKFALISHSLPPSDSGQSLVIYRMMQDLDPASYCLISTKSHEPGNSGENPSEMLPCSYHYLPPAFTLERGYRLGLRQVRENVNVLLTVLQHSRRLTDIIKREKCEAVVACTGDVTLLPASYLAARRAGIPFYAYLFDHYSYREWENPIAAFWAKRFEPWMMKGAADVIAPNETLRDDLRERFGVDAAVIHNSFDITPYLVDDPSNSNTSEASGEVNIVYTGAIYEAHYGAFRNLMAAIRKLDRPNVRLHLYTAQLDETLERAGVRGPIVRHPLQSMTEMPRVQMEADILFLPLAFDSPYPDLVRTSAPTKIGEYLAARRPILVHAPRETFVAKYFREHECGVVVDENDPARLAEGIELILSDAELCRRLIANALERAPDFSVSASRAAFARLLRLNGTS